MCERIVIPDREQVEQELSVDNPWWSFSTRFNVAATQRIPAARMHEKESEGVMMRWGLIPSSAKQTEVGPGQPWIRVSAIETVEEYRSVWMHGQRCIVPFAGFYVWQKTAAGHRQPFYVRLVNRPVFGVAALWDRFVGEDDDVIEGCALLTVPANSLLAEINTAGRQMPVILDQKNYSTWLTALPTQACGVLKPYPAQKMLFHPVGPHVNFLEYDDPSLIRPV